MVLCSWTKSVKISAFLRYLTLTFQNLTTTSLARVLFAYQISWALCQNFVKCLVYSQNGRKKKTMRKAKTTFPTSLVEVNIHQHTSCRESMVDVLSRCISPSVRNSSWLKHHNLVAYISSVPAPDFFDEISSFFSFLYWERRVFIFFLTMSRVQLSCSAFICWNNVL